MAFGKTITKEDLIAAGLDPDKFNTLIGTAVAKTDLEALKTELTNANKSAFDEIKNSIAELAKSITKPVTTPTTTTQPTEDEKKAAAYDEFTADPVAFIAKYTGNAAAQGALESKKLARQLAFDNAMKTLPGFGNSTLRAEIEEEWKKYPAEGMLRANVDPTDMIKKVHDMIMGAHMDEINRDTAKKEGKFNLVHSGGGGGSNNFVNNQHTNNTENRKPEDQLTKTELEQATRFSMTPQEWLDSKKAVDGETGIYSKAGITIQ